MRIIGFCGAQGAGKDTAYRLLSGYSVREKTCTAMFRRCAFADPLKYAAQAAFGGENRNYFGSIDDKNELISPWNVSGRQILQFLGTEMFRETVSRLVPGVKDKFWIMRLIQTAEQADPDTIHCITDVRFQNEADWILSQGGIVIRIIRPGMNHTNGIENHASERGFTMKERYYEVDNIGTPEELLNDLLKVITQHFHLYG